jgi:hypothetical protein
MYVPQSGGLLRQGGKPLYPVMRPAPSSLGDPSLTACNLYFLLSQTAGIRDPPQHSLFPILSPLTTQPYRFHIYVPFDTVIGFNHLKKRLNCVLDIPFHVRKDLLCSPPAPQDQCDCQVLRGFKGEGAGSSCGARQEPGIRSCRQDPKTSKRAPEEQNSCSSAEGK